MLFFVLTVLHFVSLASAAGALIVLAYHYWNTRETVESAPAAED